MPAYVIISLNVTDSRHTVSMLGKTRWNHLTLMHVKQWIFSEITGRAWTCLRLPWIMFSVNTTHGNRTSWCTKQMFASRPTPPEKSCGSPGWWETVNVCSILQVIQIFTVTPLWGDKLCHFDFLQRNLSVRSDGCERTFLTSGRKTFWYNQLMIDDFVLCISIIFSSL